ncbi:MAG: tetratricopeptide repeat protein [Candidatus Eisenbacteria bacterium]|nr:tetratricopeptide repeat protein [Candidatus Eisenbacteria bacterium]
MRGKRGAGFLSEKTALPLVLFLFIAANLFVYARVGGFDFINYDDPVYVTENEFVRSGLTLEGLKEAFTSFRGFAWQPVTWVSLMLDAEVRGIDPGYFHLVNLLFHIANTISLFLLLRRMTGAFWRSAFVAGLFALHPLRVESVAWISERKDVLGLFWGLASLHAYTDYARRGKRSLLVLTGFFQALSLMAKPMLVTLPFLLILFDYWPLRRLAAGPSPASRFYPARLLREKIPLFLVTAFFVGITALAQKPVEGIGGNVVSLPLGDKAANAAVSYVRYVGKILRPSDLSILYPHPSLSGGVPLSAQQVLGSAAALLAVSWAAWRLRRRRYLPVGWFWFLGSMVPIIGFVQVGLHAIADRYTYFPSIGLFVMVVWGVAEIASAAEKRRFLPARRLAIGVAMLLLTGCALASRERVACWHDSLTLYADALRAGPVSPRVLYNYGCALMRSGRGGEAIGVFKETIRLDPSYGKAYNNLGLAYREKGLKDEAARCFRDALRLDPGHVSAAVNLSALLAESGDIEGAIECRRRVAVLNGSDSKNRNDLGVLLAMSGRYTEAEAEFRRALELSPGFPEARENLEQLLRCRPYSRRAE